MAADEVKLTEMVVPPLTAATATCPQGVPLTSTWPAGQIKSLPVKLADLPGTTIVKLVVVAVAVGAIPMVNQHLLVTAEFNVRCSTQALTHEVPEDATLTKLANVNEVGVRTVVTVGAPAPLRVPEMARLAVVMVPDTDADAAVTAPDAVTEVAVIPLVMAAEPPFTAPEAVKVAALTPLVMAAEAALMAPDRVADVPL